MEFHGASGRIQDSRGDSGGFVWIAFWSRDRLCGVAGGAHGFRFDSYLRAVDQYSAGVWALDESRKHYRADDGVGWGIAGCRRDVHDSCAHFSWIRQGIYVLADFSAGAAWRLAGCAVHGAAAAAAHR